MQPHQTIYLKIWKNTSSGGAPLAAAFPQRRPITGPTVGSFLDLNKLMHLASLHAHTYHDVYIYTYLHTRVYMNGLCVLMLVTIECFFSKV